MKQVLVLSESSRAISLTPMGRSAWLRKANTDRPLFSAPTSLPGTCLLGVELFRFATTSIRPPQGFAHDPTRLHIIARLPDRHTHSSFLTDSSLLRTTAQVAIDMKGGSADGIRPC
ncbi:hypothetical protein CHELA1G11_20800 [Hyphomicrobiales bacterium]|nr:hypothetical protein CHELA1G11_20800 [Hyphomicrobiales bacterium]CAH1691999.1 hypothetical protein CHELA1G2_21115 [Hyphomicrobiales bacterium]